MAKKLCDATYLVKLAGVAKVLLLSVLGQASENSSIWLFGLSEHRSHVRS
jgi:hypothetical protein